MNYDKILVKIILSKTNKILPSKVNLIKTKYKNILNFLYKRFNDSNSIEETIRRIQTKNYIVPKCPICGNNVKYCRYVRKENKIIFSDTCSLKCSYILSEINRKNTIEKKYGDKVFFRTNKFRNCAKNTWKIKYGVDCPSKSYIIQERIKENNLNKYGVTNTSKLEIVKLKSQNTCKIKYGYKFVFQSPEVKNKITTTNIRKYGFIRYNCTEESKIKMSIKISSKEVQDKINNTKRKNNSFNTSKLEEELYLYIKEKFPSVEKQYNKDERYPWRCDFYIPELDYFIELNGTWTHGRHPYTPTSYYDNLILREWKEKSEEHPFYLNAITIWTIKDVEKRECAKNHNLNFKEVWTLEEGKKFIDELYANTESDTSTN